MISRFALTCRSDGCQPGTWLLVRAVVVRTPGQHELRGGRLQHEALAGGAAAQAGEVSR